MHGIDPDRHHAAALEEARAEALRDSDELAEWLTAECYRAAPAAWQPVLKNKTAADFAGWSVADLMALVFDAGQPAATTLAARNALTERYCARPTVAAHIAARAAHEAVRMAEDARFPEAA